ncbi:MAG: ribosome biogenesis GTP-binding protein YihA/YsxC [Clostridiales bacterium]|jgi:GTP-binding protein|nr:ribosome biogenesis GTP-binding protein YihA/YsxC [Clostridiales bacterium]
MNLNTVRLMVSAVTPAQYPANRLPEIALAGRSNVGKSSLINRLLGRKALARVSASPGKTATINFYDIDGVFNLVDLPGYGFARVSKAEKARWGVMVHTYLSERQNLAQTLQLVDMRHKPSADDIVMFDWIKSNGFAPIVIATKKDKLKPSQREAAVHLIRETLDAEEVIPFSSEKGDGCDEVWEVIRRIVGGETLENSEISLSK